MLALTSTLRFISGWRQTAHQSAARVNTGTATVAVPALAPCTQSVLPSEADDEQAFLASIAQLPADERQQRIARREWYRQLAERQALIEAEHRAQEVWWK